jgi:hypothetical protein
LPDLFVLFTVCSYKRFEYLTYLYYYNNERLSKGVELMDRIGMRAAVLDNSLTFGMGSVIQTQNASETGTRAQNAPAAGNAANNASGRFDRFENTGKPDENGKAAKTGKGNATDEGECQTCANRKYQDGSDDGGVSFQNPTKLSPAQAASAVRSHEQEHVTRNAAKAEREGKEAHSSVAIHTAVCPECGKTYVSGGTTTTTFTEKKDDDKDKLAIEGIEKGSGKREGAGKFKPVGDPNLLRKFGAGTSAYVA